MAEEGGFVAALSFFEIASSLVLLAMTRWGGVIATLFIVIASEAWQSQKNQILNPKSEILNNVKEQSVISSQQSAVSNQRLAND